MTYMPSSCASALILSCFLDQRISSSVTSMAKCLSTFLRLTLRPDRARIRRVAGEHIYGHGTAVGRVEQQGGALEMPSGEALLDPRLPPQQPVEHVEHFVAADGTEAEQGTEAAGDGLRGQAASGGELGAGLEHAGDYGARARSRLRLRVRCRRRSRPS